MARDYRPRQPQESAQKPMLESRSARHKRQEKQQTNRNAWLVMLLVIGAMVGGYWVINHFANSGLKSGSLQGNVAEIDSVSEEESVVTLDEPSQEALSMEEPSVEEPDLLEEDAVELLSEPLALQDDASAGQTGEASALQESREIRAQALDVPKGEQMYGEPKKNFYSELKELEVVPDDTTPEPVALEKPKYILAGSFFSESAALRAQKRMAQHDQNLKVRVSVRKDGKHIYALYTEPYYNRLELNKRKNQLRKLGASVMELEYNVAEQE